MEHRVCRISQTIEILQNYIDEMTQSFWERSKPEFDLAVIGMMILFFVGSTYTYRSHRRLREYNIVLVHSELSKLDRDRALAHMHGQISFQIVHSEEERSTSVDAGASSTIYYSCTCPIDGYMTLIVAAINTIHWHKIFTMNILEVTTQASFFFH